MKRYLSLIVVVLSAFSISGCIGENYYFTPPTVSFSGDSGVYELKEANVSWQGENGKPITKETKNIQKSAMKQKKMNATSQQPVKILLDNTDEELKELTVTVWKGNEKIQVLELTIQREFKLPKEQGEYVIELNLRTASGKAQYIGNIDVS